MIKLRVQDWDQFILRSSDRVHDGVLLFWVLSPRCKKIPSHPSHDHPSSRETQEGHPIPSQIHPIIPGIITVYLFILHQTTTNISLIDNYWDSRIQSIWQLRIFENEYIIRLTNHQNKGLGSTTSIFSSNVQWAHYFSNFFPLSHFECNLGQINQCETKELITYIFIRNSFFFSLSSFELPIIWQIVFLM